MVSTNEGCRGVGFAHSTEEGSNDTGGKGGQQKASADKTSGTGDQGNNDGKKKGTRSEIRQSSVIDAVCQQGNTGQILQPTAQRQGSGRGRCDKKTYGENLSENLDDLLKKNEAILLQTLPSAQSLHPEGKRQDAWTGHPSFEDKVVQGVFKEILEGIYEPKFLDFSYGFRPNRSCHDAIQKVNKHIMADKVNYVVDADIKGFFDNIDHDWMVRFLEHDIADKNFIRYIKRFLIGGVMEDGKKLNTEVGTVQGGLISPVLANVYLHYVLDTWFVYISKREFSGEMYMVRYADDFVCLFQYEQEAQKFYRMLVRKDEEIQLKDKPIQRHKESLFLGTHNGKTGQAGFPFKS